MRVLIEKGALIEAATNVRIHSHASTLIREKSRCTFLPHTHTIHTHTNWHLADGDLDALLILHAVGLWASVHKSRLFLLPTAVSIQSGKITQ